MRPQPSPQASAGGKPEQAQLAIAQQAYTFTCQCTCLQVGVAATSRFTLYLDDATQALVGQAAAAHGMSKSRWVAELIRKHAAHEWPLHCLAAAGQFATLQRAEDVQVQTGDRVVGVLPIGWAARICALGAEAHLLTLSVPAALRGKELSAEDLDALGAQLVRYEVQIVETVAAGDTQRDRLPVQD